MPGGVVPRAAKPDEQLIRSLRSSFALMAPHRDRLATIFYDRLFALHPAVRAMFPNDMTAQRVKLTDSLVMVIEGLQAPEAMKERLRALGSRHVAYGAKPEHYPIVCECLLFAMRQVSPEWTPEIAADWERALRLISANMQSGSDRGA